jgi:hypothetical protein
MQQGQEPHVFSMASWKQCQFNERLLDVFMENLALDPTWVKNHSCYSMIKFFVLDVLLGRVVAVSSDPAPDSAFAPSFFGRPLGQLP